IRQFNDFGEKHMGPCTANQCYASRAPVPATTRFRPAEDFFDARLLGHHHRRNQIVSERIVISPAADPPEPLFEQLEFFISTLRVKIFEEKLRSDFFL